MKIDNSMFSMYMKCPLMYFERYEAKDLVQFQPIQKAGSQAGAGELAAEASSTSAGGLSGIDPGGTGGVQEAALGQCGSDVLPIIQPGIELDKPAEGRDFGTRMHQLLHLRRLVLLEHSALAVERTALEKEWPDEDIEAEAQATLAAYEAHYVRDYEYIESERTHCLPIERCCPECGGQGHPKLDLPSDRRACEDCGHIYTIHELCVKLDAVVRHSDATIGPFDTKTESKPGYNTREDWAGRTQAKIYLYALNTLYPAERVSRLVVDVVSRGSPKARRAPIFYRHDDISSPPEAIQEAIRNVCWVADDIERSRKSGWWRSNMNLCKRGWEKCDYYDLHVSGRTSENLKKYKAAEAYLDL